MEINGIAKLDKRTKRLAKRIKKGDIAIIDHKDIDSTAALMLVEAQVGAVINVSSSSSGRYPNLGPLTLLKNNIFLLDQVDPGIFDKIKEGTKINIIDNNIFADGMLVASGTVLDKELIDKQLKIAGSNLGAELESFIKNTLSYMSQEKNIILEAAELPELKTKITNRHCLIVIRGENYKEDLKAIRSYIYDVKPILIGVDGGADAIVEIGFKPDIIVGDMDSVTDQTLGMAKEIVVHAYKDGKAPGLNRINELGLSAFVCPIIGTSEDLAFLIAYEKGAELITAVGTHSDMIDFLDKGRNGMSSTFLTRLKIGHRFVDAKGVSKLYRHTPSANYLAFIVIAAIVTFIAVLAVAPNTFDYIQEIYHDIYSQYLSINVKIKPW